MSKTKFNENQIEKLKDNINITFISEKSISFTPEFKVQIATCKTFVDAKHLLKKEGIDPEVLGQIRSNKLYHRLRNQYRLKGSAAFTSETRGRKKIQDKKTYNNASDKEKLKQAEKRIKDQQEEIEMLKKFTAFLPKSCKKANKFECINRFIEQYTYREYSKTQTIKLLCSYLGVSISGYYKYKSFKSTSAKQKIDKIILDHIAEIQNMKFRKSKSKFKRIGYRQVTDLINTSGRYQNSINHKRIYRLMKESNQLSQYRRKNPYRELPLVTKEHKTFDNLIAGNFESPYAYNVLCTDITYLVCKNFRAYMSAIKDAATSKIVAYKISNNLKIDFVLDTICQLDENELNDETVIHSDQGSHYTSPQFTNLIKTKGITQSMSRRGKCTDNAPIESFFGHMKCEVAYEDCKNIVDLQELMLEYINYYNNQRIQRKKNNMTPNQFENHIMNN